MFFGIYDLVVAIVFALVPWDNVPFWKRFAIGLIGSTILLAVYCFAAPPINEFLNRAEAAVSPELLPLGLGMAAIASGAGAHYLKMKNKLRYGQAEVVFGALSAMVVSERIRGNQPLFASVIVLCAAASVVARGLNNWSDALQAEGQTLKKHLRSWVFEDDDEGVPASR